MCGRYNVTDDPAVRYLMAKLGLPLYEVDELLNIQPTAFVPIVIREDGETKVVNAVWWLLLTNGDKGMVPNPKWKTFNAVSSRAHTSKLYAPALRNQRCIMPASGYYEFKPESGYKQAYHIAPESGAIAFAGLYRKWQYEGGSLYSCSLMTTEGHPKLAHIHKKSLPVMLTEEDYDPWLSNEELTQEHRAAIFESKLRENFTAYPVDRSVNTASTKSGVCLEPIGEEEKYTADG